MAKIKIIDDDMECAENIAHALEKAGHTVSIKKLHQECITGACDR